MTEGNKNGIDDSIVEEEVNEIVEENNNSNSNSNSNNNNNNNDDEEGAIIRGGDRDWEYGYYCISDTNIPSLVGAFIASLTTGGTVYAFGLYASALKKALHLRQSELDSISAAFFCAGLFSWIPGLCVDTYGPRFSLCLGGITGATSLILYWTVATSCDAGKDPTSRHFAVLALSVLGIVAFLSCALITGSVFKTIVSTTGPGTRGTAVGAAKGYVGLGSGFYAALFEALRRPQHSQLDLSNPYFDQYLEDYDDDNDHIQQQHPHEEQELVSKLQEVLDPDTDDDDVDVSDLNFLLMAAFFTVAAVTIPALLLLPPRDKATGRMTIKRDAATPLHFRMIYLGLISLGAVVVGSTIIALSSSDQHENHPHSSSSSSSHRSYGTGITLLLVWLGPLLSLLCLPINKNPNNNTTNTSTSSSSSEQPAYNVIPEKDDDILLSSRTQTTIMTELTDDPHLDQDDNYDDDDDDAQKDLGKFISNKHNLPQSILQSTIQINENNINHEHDNDDADDDEHDNVDVEEGRDLIPRSLPQSQPSSDHHNNNNNTSSTSSSASSSSPNLNLVGMLRTLSAWLMLWTTTILVGAGTVMTNNVGQMTEALHFDSTTAPASLALFSAAQAASRVLAGSISESALRWPKPWRLTRPAFFVISSAMASLSHFWLGIATTRESFVGAVALSGAAFGMIWPILVLTIGECFGPANVGANYLFFDGFTSALGTLILSKFVAQEVYESHIDDGNSGNNDGGDGLTCFGEDCFRMTHIIVSVLSLTSIVTSLALTYQTRDIYATMTR